MYIFAYLYTILQFAAIVSDPPFGIREKAYGHAQSYPTTNTPTTPNSTMGDCKRAVSTLFSIAKQHLQLHGKLVFWLPTPAEVTNEGLQVILNDIIAYTGDIQVAQELVYIKATPQYLHSKLTRWLCVYQKIR